MTALEAQLTPPRLLKEPAARRYLGNMSHGQFWELRQAKLIPTIRVKRSVFFDINDLDAFIESIRPKGRE